MNKNLGMNFNIAVVFDDESNISVGMNYNDSRGIEISTQVEGDDVVEVIDALTLAFMEDYINIAAEQEPEPMSELDKLKAENEKLKEENIRLQEQLSKKEPVKKEVTQEEVDEALKYVDDIIELFNMLYK
jgi:regulator of replication initiation timing